MAEEKASKFKNQSSGEELSLKDLISRQCDRIHIAIMMPVYDGATAKMRSDMLSNGLDILETMLGSDMTEEMKSGLERIYEKANKSINNISKGYPRPEDANIIINEIFMWSKAKYKELWRIMKKLDLLPTKGVVYREVKDDDIDEI